MFCRICRAKYTRGATTPIAPIPRREAHFGTGFLRAFTVHFRPTSVGAGAPRKHFYAGGGGTLSPFHAPPIEECQSIFQHSSVLQICPIG